MHTVIFVCQWWQLPLTPMNTIENYYNCIRNSQVERYLYRYEYLHLVSAVETVLNLVYHDKIGCSSRFCYRMAPDTAEHSSHCLWPTKESLIAKACIVSCLWHSVVFALESRFSDRAPDPLLLSVLIPQLRDSRFLFHSHGRGTCVLLLSSQCPFIQRHFHFHSSSSLWSSFHSVKWIADVGPPVNITSEVPSRHQSTRDLSTHHGNLYEYHGFFIIISCFFRHLLCKSLNYWMW